MQVGTGFQKSELSWFLRLRRLAFIGQALVLVWATAWLALNLPIQSLIVTLLLIPLGEILFKGCRKYFKRLSSEQALGGLLIWDTIVLSLLLALSGGPTNPFSIVYLVHVVLSATLLGSLWTWCITLLSTLCFAALFFWHYPINEFHHMDHSAGLSLHLKGMLLSYLLVSTLVAYFLGRILSEKNRAEQRAQRLASAQQKLAAMTALSSDAAHRLGTPLASLGLVAHELRRMADQYQMIKSSDIRDDIYLLNQEILRCKEIIGDLCSKAGNAPGEQLQETSVRLLLEQATLGFPGQNFAVSIAPQLQDYLVLTQRGAIELALKNLLQNAIDANRLSASNRAVKVSAAINNSLIEICIDDSGPGMTEQQLVQLKEPFFTTKQGGMGLGVYIAELVALQLEGRLEFYSQLGSGTRAKFSIPIRGSVAHQQAA